MYLIIGLNGFKWDVVRSGRHKEWGPIMPVPKVKSTSKSYLHLHAVDPI